MDSRARTEPTRAWIVDASDTRLAARTARALDGAGVSSEVVAPARLASALARASGPAWIVAAGAWPLASFTAPPPSATGRSLIALGAVRHAPCEQGSRLVAAWDEVLARTGGDLANLRRGAQWPPIASVWAEHPAHVADAIASEGSLERGLEKLARGKSHRAVRVPSLDVACDLRLRVVHTITSLQAGGAERLAIDLTHGLRVAGVCAAIVTIDRPGRLELDAPEGTVRVAHGDRTERVRKLGDLVAAFGADVVHAHLLERADLTSLARTCVPVVTTIHNARAGWQSGTDALTPRDVSLAVACSIAVERDLREANPALLARTIWNGTRPRARDADARARIRGLHGAAESALVMLAVANPRPQKRLERLPAVVAELRARGADAHLWIAGEAGRSPGGIESHAALRAQIESRAVGPYVREVGATTDVAALYSAADVLVNVSAYEGLSVAQLEALAHGLPVVATNVGGAAEIAAKCKSMRLVDADADARAIADAVCARGEGSGLPEDFSISRAARRHVELYRRVCTRHSARRGLVLVTNNFSTGGAQTSARRLLGALARRGVAVRAVVLQEQRELPTPGRAALEREGIAVFAAPCADEHDAAHTVAAALASIDADPPEAVLLWNVIPEHKILLADALVDVPVFDVSPGEMFFASLERYFARPRVGMPYLSARDYGARLAGVVVKYPAEADRAAAVLGAPVHVVPNGVPSAPAPRASVVRDRLVLGTAARLSADKRLEDLIDALALAAPRMPPFVLRVAGGPERGGEAYAASLRSRARDLPVEWLGELPSSGPLLEDLDLFVMISEPAGCPNASLEAMAAGVPLVVTDVGGAADQVLDGECGRVVPRRDARALADAIVELSCDAPKRARFGAAAWSRAREAFSMEAMAAAYARSCLGHGANEA